MSMADALAFYEMVQQDDEIRARLSALPEDEESAYAAGLRIASDAGYVFTVDEAKAVIERRAGEIADGEELSDEQLEAVSGGKKSKTRLPKQPSPTPTPDDGGSKSGGGF